MFLGNPLGFLVERREVCRRLLCASLSSPNPGSAKSVLEETPSLHLVIILETKVMPSSFGGAVN